MLLGLRDKNLLVVLFDEENKPRNWVGIPGSSIASALSLGNDKPNGRGRWYLRNYSGDRLLTSLRDLTKNETDGFFENEDTSLKQFVERCKA